MIWCKQEKAPAAPPPPKRVTPLKLQVLRLAAQKNPGAPLNKYLLAHLPTEQFDRWLQPLPLSIVQQDRLDRMVAVLEQPLERGRALLVSGTLDTLERDALKEGRPEAYDAIYAQAVREMATAGPPLPAWADGVLGILFGRDAAHVFAEETTDADGKPKGGQFTGKPPVPTPAEQQDTIRHGKAG